jgi:hypothetical protein
MDPEQVITNLPFIRKTDPRIAAVIDKYRLSVIGYAFDFTITENNNNQANADFKLPFKTTTFTLGLQGSANLMRSGERKIDVIESFQELGSLQCGDAGATGINIVYPITGSIGMDEIIHSFLSVSESIPLQPTEPAGTEKKLVDTLTFTTSLDSSVTPQVKLAPAKPGKQFQLADAMGTFESKRVDVHKVVVTLTFPVVPAAAPAKAAPANAPAAKTGTDGAPAGKTATDSASASKPANTPPAIPSALAPAAPISAASGVARKAAAPATLRDNSKYKLIQDATKEKVAEELCIQRALQREEQLNITRLDAPEVYCTNNITRY